MKQLRGLYAQTFFTFRTVLIENSTFFNKFHVRCVNQMCEIVKEQLNALAFTNVILLRVNRRHLSATLVVIFRVMGTDIQGVS